jgi:cell wall-associated NlpC family hydrolase
MCLKSSTLRLINGIPTTPLLACRHAAAGDGRKVSAKGLQRMRLTRTTAAMFLVAASIPAFASAPWAPTPNCDLSEQQVATLLLPAELAELAPGFETASLVVAPALNGAIESAPTTVYAPRELLVEMAMKLRDIRYRRGGRAPSTGFDCSGFVQYVFAHALGIDLPDDSVSQSTAGIRVARNELKTGDLVFFHTRGKGVSHVGIYLDNGRFIHSPSTGKRVRVDELSDRYWARRYVGARRPEVLSS